MATGYIQQKPGRHGVGDAYGVDSIRSHLSKIPLDDFYVLVFPTLLIGPEGPISHAFDEEFFTSNEDELPAHLRASGGLNDGIHEAVGTACGRNCFSRPMKRIHIASFELALTAEAPPVRDTGALQASSPEFRCYPTAERGASGRRQQ